jgi:hypothetical protein
MPLLRTIEPSWPGEFRSSTFGGHTGTSGEAV